MREAAQAGRWEELVTLEEARRPLIESTFPPEGPAESDPRIAEVLREIVAIDQHVMELGAQARDEAAVQLRGLSKGRRAVDAYATANRR